MPAFLYVAQSTLLLYTTQVAGIVLLVMTMILVAKRRIYFDAESKAVTEVELPFFGKVKTQAPALVLVLVGAVMVLVPLQKMGADTATVEGTIDSGGRAVTVLVVPVPHYQQSVTGDFTLPVPLLSERVAYRVKYIVDNRVVQDSAAEVKGDKIVLRPFNWQPPPGLEVIPAKKEVSDAELQKLLFSE